MDAHERDLVRAADRGAWRRWLVENHGAESEAWLLFYKKRSGKASVSYDEAVEEALCFGWIDGILRRVDDESYAQRFTPRRAGSAWSQSNLARMARLIESGAATEAGLKVYASRSPERPDAERLASSLEEAPSEFESALRKNPVARRNFERLSPSHRRRYVLWIVSAKRAETRERRIRESVELIEKDTKELMK
ncbi:MAG: YdeI/OmpD-associated family protein [Nitrososphaerales archaeon]